MRLLATPKPWDFLEPLSNPLESMERILDQFLEADTAASAQDED